MDRVVWITGAGGLIGSHLARIAPREWHVRALTRADLELTDFDAVRSAFRRDAPQQILHCAAMSKTPDCERHPEDAWKHNVDVTRHLCELAAHIPLLFFSTDLVFDGQKGNYEEPEQPNPLSVYGKTKVVAEGIVLTNPLHTVIRTSLNAGGTPSGDRSFDEQLRAVWARGEVTKVFTDEFRSPIAADVTARAAWELVQAQARGVFHVAGPQRMSRFEIARLVAATCTTVSPRLEPSSIHDYGGPPRSPDTSLNSMKAQALLSFRLPRFEDSLRAQALD
jgi:dTDP-4-dehydrorhamnose reductase